MSNMEAQATSVPAIHDQVQKSKEKSSLLGRAWDKYESGVGKLAGWVSRGSGNLGSLISKRPMMTLVLSIIISILICLGWMRFGMENESDKLWVPNNSKAIEDRDVVESQYPRGQSGASLYAQDKADPTSNALLIPITWEIFKVHAKILAIEVDGETNGSRVTYAQICNKDFNGDCRNSGYLNYFGYSFDQFISAIDGSYTDPTVGNATAFVEITSQTKYPDGKSISMLSLYGGVVFNYSPFSVASAQVIAVDYPMDGDVSDGVAESWHKEFTALMKELLPEQQYMTFTWITGSSVGEEIGSSVAKDFPLVIIAIIIFIIVSILLMSKWDSVKTRTTLAVGGVLVTCLSIVTGYGLTMLFGIPFTVLQQTTPFIILGMGVDVIFVLVKSYEIIIARQPGMTLAAAMYKMMSTAGVSVQVTLLASAVAFALGATATLNSVKWFAIYATMCTVMLGVLMCTLFIAMFVYTEKRIEARYKDCICCSPCKSDPEAPAVSHNTAPMDTHGVQVFPPTANHMSNGMDVNRKLSKLSSSDMSANVADDGEVDENWLKSIVRTYYAPALTKWYVKVIVILLFGAYMGLCFYATTDLTYGQPLGDLAPDDSYLKKYSEMMDSTYDQQVGGPAGVYFTGVDISPTYQQYNALATLNLALQNEFVNASTSVLLYNWLISFNQWVAKTQPSAIVGGGCYNPYIGKLDVYLGVDPFNITGCVDEDQFYTLLSSWQATVGSNSQNFIKVNELGYTSSFYYSIMHTAPSDDDKYGMELIKSIRHLEDNMNGEYYKGYKHESLFMWSNQYLFYEGDAILPSMALEYFILAIIGVGVIILLMLVNPLTSLLMMCAVGMVSLFLFGELWVLGIRFNQVSIINMIMATGLATDYSVYFAQKFMMCSADGTRNGRMKTALTDTGSAVLLGGITAMVGSIPMAFSSSIIIRTFFKLLLGTIIFALLIGLMFMPVIFSLIGPPPLKTAIAMQIGGAPDDDEILKHQNTDTTSHTDASTSHLDSIKVQASSK